MTATDSRADRGYGVPHRVRAAELRSGDDPLVFPDSQPTNEAHVGLAVGDPNSHPATADARPTGVSPGGPQLNLDHVYLDAQVDHVEVARPPRSGSTTTNGPADGTDFSNNQSRPATQSSSVVADGQDQAQSPFDPHADNGPVLADPLLALAADVVDDLERVRIANENRLRQLTRDETDSDGEERGFGLTLDHPDVKRLAALVAALGKAEHDAELNLKRQMRQHPLGPWVKQARGVGEKQAARLLASLGDPYWNDLRDRPRTVSELWAYSGYHVAAGAAVARARGQRANWSATAKMRAHLVAVSIVKAGGPYREVYDAGRAQYADAVHHGECKRCGPSGKPALPGSALSDGHKHARALRLVAKEVLRDLWREAKRLHGLHDGQSSIDAHSGRAVVDPISSSQKAVDTQLFDAAGSTSEVDQ